MTVVIGGTGNITLGDVTGFPNISETLGTGKSFYYAFLNINLSPIEVGFGIMLDAITLQRDVIEAAMIDGVYTADGVTPANIPVGAIMFTAPTKGMLDLLMLEMSLRDYGNVTGAVTMSAQYKALKFNCTGNTTLTLNQLPPTGAKAELTLHASSANAGTADIGKGYLLTLPSSCKLGKNNCPAIPLLHDAETIIKLTTIDGGTTWQVLWYNGHANIRDLGDLTGTINLDIRYLQSKGNLAAGSSTTLTIEGIDPAAKLGEPAHFVIKNSSTGNRFIAFDADEFTLIGSTLNTLVIPLGYKLDFTVRKNPHANDADPAYDVWVNGINYDVTASGLATTWNPSDYFGTPPLTLTDSNRTIEMTTQSGTLAYRSARAFGGKQTGKWYFSLRCDKSVVGLSGSVSWLAIGLATGSISLASQVGAAANSAAWFTNRGASIVTQTWDEGASTARASYSPVLNDIVTILYDGATGKGWVMLNNTVLYGGDPEAGTNPAFTLTAGNIYFPMISIAESSSSSADSGIWTILNEVQSAHVPLVAPSYQCWTA